MNWKEFLIKETGIFTAEDEMRTCEDVQERKWIVFNRFITHEKAFEICEDGNFRLKNMDCYGPEVCKEVVDFLNQGKVEWFKENKYNIILARDYDPKRFYTAYMHWGNTYSTNDEVKPDDLSEEDYVFTQEQIDDLKSHLPENMAKIVDLAKVEVKDNDD